MKKKKRKLKNSIRETIKIILIIAIIIIIICCHPFNSKEKKETKKTIKKETKIEKTCKKIDYCHKDYYQRYENYQKQNKNLTPEEVITRVNIGLDNSFYTNTKDTPYLNTTYILVNKYYHLGEDYVPENLERINTSYARSGMTLVTEAKNAFEKMAEQAKKDNSPIIAMSSYRSYEYQVNLYNRYAKTDGVDAADTYSARAGFSEHQTGLCVDIYDGKIDYTKFEQSNSYNWMQENAYKYGFILRFPKGKEDITGYQYESWHYRYVGEKIAKYIKENNITFEEYYTKFIEDKM